MATDEYQCARLLSDHYAARDTVTANSVYADIDRVITPQLRRHIYGRGYRRDEVDDLAQEVRIRLFSALERSKAPGASPIGSIARLSYTITERVIWDDIKKNSPRRIMAERIYYLTTAPKYSDRFARWEIETIWIAGLASWRGMPARETERYLAIVRNPTAFIEATLVVSKASTIRQVKFSVLMDLFLQWIASPLAERKLAERLLELQPIEILVRDDGPVEDERGLGDRFADKGPEDNDTIPWENIWGAACRLRRTALTVLILSLDPEALVILCGNFNPRDMIAKLLPIDPDRFGAFWKELPLDDEMIAEVLGITVGNVQTMRSRLRKWFGGLF